MSHSIVQRLALIAVASVAVGCASTSTPSTLDRAEAAAVLRIPEAPKTAPPAASHPATARASSASPIDPVGGVDRRTLEREAVARDPQLAAAEEEVRALVASARARGSLPDPMLSMTVQQVPLERPYAVDEATMLMVGLEQAFPAPGSLGMREEAIGHEALAAAATLRAMAAERILEVDQAFADYVEASARVAARETHRGLLQRTVAVAVARSSAGAPVSDATQAALELARVEAELETDRAMIDAARARLNGLLLRPVDAALGPPIASSPPLAEPRAGELATSARSRPELVAAAEQQEAAKQRIEASEREELVPSFGVGVAYFAPVGAMARHGYGVSVSASLPWLWGPRADQSAADRAGARAAAARSRAVLARVEAEVALAAARVTGAQRRLAVLRDVARPAAGRAIDLAEAGYQSGGVDLLRLLAAADGAIAVELDLVSAEGALERALADLDRAVGAPPTSLRAEENPR